MITGICAMLFFLALHDVIGDHGACTPWIYNVKTKKCYRKYCLSYDRKLAESHCNMVGGHLVTICDEEENEFVAFLSYVSYGEKDTKRLTTLIGLRRSEQDFYTFVWLSGAKCNFRAWLEGEPNNGGYHHDETDVEIFTDIERYTVWNDIKSYYKPAYFVCERKNCPLKDSDD